MYLILSLLLAFAEVNSYLVAGEISRFHVARANGSSWKRGDDEPCDVQFGGSWSDFVNISFTPNPPRLDTFVKLTVDLIAKEDIWALTGKANATMEGSQIVLRTEKTFCNFHVRPYLCPAHKGESRHYEKELNIGYVPKGTYSANLEVFNQDDEVILTITVRKCSIK